MSRGWERTPGRGLQDATAKLSRPDRFFPAKGYEKQSSRGIILLNPLAMGARDNTRCPCLIGEVPLDGLTQTGLETFARLPFQLISDFRRIDRITPVMTRTILHECDLIPARSTIGSWTFFFEDVANRINYVDVGLLATPADAIGLTDRSLGDDGQQCAGVIVHEQPVAHILPVAIHRQRFSLTGIQDHERDQFFRKLVRSVVVRAVRSQDRQFVRVMVGAHQMIGSRFGQGDGRLAATAIGAVLGSMIGGGL